jgi:hypothetical protein
MQAIHESAHAVVAITLGLWFEYVVLDGDRPRVVRLKPDDPHPSLYDATPDVEIIVNEFAMELAGPVADKKTGVPDLESRVISKHESSRLRSK